MTRSVVVLTIIANFLNSTTATAQLWRLAPQLIGVGDRVRVGIRDDTSRGPFAMAAQHIRGTVHAIAPETLYVDLPDAIGTGPSPRAAIAGVEMSTGAPSRTGCALDVGSAGALLGGLFLPSFIRRADHRFGSSGGAFVASAGIGFGIGALIGVLVPYERWRVAWIPE